VYVLYIAYRDPRTPFLARTVAAVVVAYALSPIDLIPDFVPVLGYLDDLLLVPAGVALAVRLIPGPVLADARVKATAAPALRSPWGAAIVIAAWLLAAAGVVWLLARVRR
jgi:uncharacterized membrane protein YkvA (DUF1232 family)